MMDDREQAPAEPKPSDDKQRQEQGRKNRDEFDATPPPGTDPLHEGP